MEEAVAKLERKKHGEVLTPDSLIDKMLKQAGDLTGKKVADLGANRGQFLRRALLMYPTIDPMDWTLLEVQERYHRYHRRYTGWKVQHELKEPVDILLGNPPYNSGLDLKLMLKYRGLYTRALIVHPSTWLIDVKTQLGAKTGSPLFRKFRDLVGPYLKSVGMFNGNPVFNVGLFVPCVITDMDMGWARQQGVPIKVKDVGQEEYRGVSRLEDITLHGVAWRSCVKEFMGRVQKLCAKNGSLGGHHEDPTQVPQGTYVVQLASIIGNHSYSSVKMVKDDFYTFLMKDPEGNRGIRKQSGKMPAIRLQAAIEVDNLASSISEVTVHGEEWRKCVQGLHSKLSLFCKDGANLWSHNLRSWGTSHGGHDPQGLYVQLASVKGHVSMEPGRMVLEDFYTILQKDTEDNRGVRMPNLDRPGNPIPTYKVSSRAEQDNLLGYLQTDFARLCLSLLKTNQDLATGALAMVPWLDFTRSWSDDQLFSMLGYPRGHAIREYAKRFLPDYHGVYPNGKTY